MLRSSMLSAGAVLLFAGLAYGQGSPEAAFKEFQEAMKAKDGDKAWTLLSKNSHSVMDKSAAQLKETITKLESAPPEAQKAVVEQFNKTFGLSLEEMKKLDGRGLFVAVIKNSDALKSKDGPAELASATLSDVKIEGDKATGTVKTTKKTDEMHFVKEDGAWKIDMSQKRKATPKAATKDDAKKGN